MITWKKAVALMASVAALASMAACGSGDATSGSGDNGGKKKVGFVAVGPEGGYRIKKAFKDAGSDLVSR